MWKGEIKTMWNNVILNGTWFLRGTRNVENISKLMQYIKAETETHKAALTTAITSDANQRVVLKM